MSKLVLSFALLFVFSMNCFSQDKEKPAVKEKSEIKVNAKEEKKEKEFIDGPIHITSEAHTHTETLKKGPDGLVESGTLVNVVVEVNNDLSHHHLIVDRIPFINTNNLTEAELKSVLITTQTTNKTLEYKTKEITTPSGEKVKVAYELKIKN